MMKIIYQGPLEDIGFFSSRLCIIGEQSPCVGTVKFDNDFVNNTNVFNRSICFLEFPYMQFLLKRSDIYCTWSRCSLSAKDFKKKGHGRA